MRPATGGVVRHADRHRRRSRSAGSTASARRASGPASATTSSGVSRHAGMRELLGEERRRCRAAASRRRRAAPRAAVNPVRARHAASVWRRSRANGASSATVTSWIRAHASDVAGSACDATKPSECFARSASSNGSFQCFDDRLGDVLAGARDAAAEHRLAARDDDDVGALVADVDHRDRAIGAAPSRATACARRAGPQRRRTASTPRGSNPHCLPSVDQLLGALAAHRVASARACPRRAARPGRAAASAGASATPARRRRRRQSARSSRPCPRDRPARRPRARRRRPCRARRDAGS